MCSGQTVDRAAKADRVIGAAPMAALDRDAGRDAAVDIGEGQDLVLAIVPADASKMPTSVATCCSPLT